ncbi:MAG: hypothetical protein CFE23_04160 [Flavobacterium sp. BFFFF1]|nr:MAG: hypothetical protein CFE23_04160 [Flavobacterium sp. BFFFF1]
MTIYGINKIPSENIAIIISTDGAVIATSVEATTYKETIHTVLVAVVFIGLIFKELKLANRHHVLLYDFLRVVCFFNISSNAIHFNRLRILIRHFGC